MNIHIILLSLMLSYSLSYAMTQKTVVLSTTQEQEQLLKQGICPLCKTTCYVYDKKKQKTTPHIGNTKRHFITCSKQPNQLTEEQLEDNVTKILYELSLQKNNHKSTSTQSCSIQKLLKQGICPACNHQFPNQHQGNARQHLAFFCEKVKKGTTSTDVIRIAHRLAKRLQNPRNYHQHNNVSYAYDADNDTDNDNTVASNNNTHADNTSKPLYFSCIFKHCTQIFSSAYKLSNHIQEHLH